MEMRLSQVLSIAAAAALLPLGACMTTPEYAQGIAAHDDAACRDAGMKSRTPAYAKCREALSNRRAVAQSIEAQATRRQMWEMQQMSTRQWMSRPM